MLKDAFSRGEKVYQIYICRAGLSLKSVRAYVLKNTEKQGRLSRPRLYSDLEEETFDRIFPVTYRETRYCKPYTIFGEYFEVEK